MRSLIRGSRVLSAMAITFHLGGSLGATTGQVRKRTTYGHRKPMSGNRAQREPLSRICWPVGRKPSCYLL